MSTEESGQIDSANNISKKKGELNLRKLSLVSLIVAVLIFLAIYFYCIFNDWNHPIARSCFGATIAFPIFFFIVILLEAVFSVASESKSIKKVICLQKEGDLQLVGPFSDDEENCSIEEYLEQYGWTIDNSGCFIHSKLKDQKVFVETLINPEDFTKNC